MMNKTEKLELLTPWVDSFWSCTSTNAQATERLNKAATGILVSVFDQVPMLDKANPRVPEPYVVQVMRKRALELRMPFTEAAFCMLAIALIDSSPAVAHMYLCAIKHDNVANGGDQINAHALMYSALDSKVFGPVDLERHWAAQKLPGVNLLDTLGPDDFLAD